MKRKRSNCDCGRPATQFSNGNYVCDFCFECERKGCSGGPTNRDGKYAVKDEEPKETEQL